jgi:hypothetical protein
LPQPPTGGDRGDALKQRRVEFGCGARLTRSTARHSVEIERQFQALGGLVPIALSRAASAGEKGTIRLVNRPSEAALELSANHRSR